MSGSPEGIASVTMPVRRILERRPIYCGRRLLTLGMTALTITASVLFPADIAEQAVAQAEGSGPGAGRPVAAAPGRAHEHAVAAREDVLAAVIHLLAVDAHIAEAAGPAALEAGRGKLRPLRHEAQHDGAGGSALDEYVLAEAAPVPPGASRIRPQPLVVEEERAIALRHLHGRARDIAGPREHVLAVLGGGRAHAAIEEEDVRVGSPVVAGARLGHRPERRARAGHHLVGNDLVERA